MMSLLASLLSRLAPTTNATVLVRVSVRGLNFQTFIGGIFWSTPSEVFSGYSDGLIKLK